jgi:hypothetical protein
VGSDVTERPARILAGQNLQHAGAPLLPILVSMLEHESREVQSKLAMPTAGLFLSDSDNLESARRPFFANHRVLAPMIEIFKARYIRRTAAYGDLLKVYHSGDAAIQEQVMIAIGRIGDMRMDNRHFNPHVETKESCKAANSAILPALGALVLGNADKRVRLSGIETLDALNGTDAAEVLDRLSQTDPARQIRKAAADAMARILERHKVMIAEREN